MSQRPFIRDGEFKGSVEVETDGCRHNNSYNTGETCFEGCCDRWRCNDCGRTFLVECPD